MWRRYASSRIVSASLHDIFKTLYSKTDKAILGTEDDLKELNVPG